MSAKHCPTLYAFNQDGNLIAVRCGSWYCPRCMKINARQWSFRVSLHISKSGKTAWFWTLTLGSKYHTAQEGFDALPKLWKAFQQYIHRLYPGRWEYVAFVEGQPERGHMPHFHIISLIKAPKRLKDIAVWSGFGYMAKELKVTNARAAAYVTKYASKQSPETPPRFRRVRASRGWSKLPDHADEKLYVRARAEHVQDYLERVSAETGVPIDDLADTWLHKVTEYDYWERS